MYLGQKRGIMPPSNSNYFERKDLFGGSGRVRIWNLISNQQNQIPFTASLWCSLEGHGFVGPHKQQECPEIIICLSGNGTVKVQQISHDFQVGVQVYLPLGSVLSIKNTSGEELEYLIIKAEISKSS